MKLMKKDIRPNEEVETFLALESLQVRKSRNQRDFLELGLHDKTGKINGYLWNNPLEAAAELKEKTVVKVKGIASKVNGTIIINVERIRTASKDEFEIQDFLEVVPGGVSFWHKRLISIVETVSDPHCSELIEAFLGDGGFLELFITSPGGLSIHHNYIGGLLEHTTSAMEMVSSVSDRHPGLLNRNQLITGAFLHDIGKAREIYWEISREYTTEGKLLGHIALGLMMVDKKLATIKDFPEELANLLRHMILSHHGRLEYGSPVKPATPEALALHLMEQFDAKINHLYCHMGNSDPEKDWSEYDRILETQIYQKKYAEKDARHMAVAA